MKKEDLNDFNLRKLKYAGFDVFFWETYPQKPSCTLFEYNLSGWEIPDAEVFVVNEIDNRNSIVLQSETSDELWMLNFEKMQAKGIGIFSIQPGNDKPDRLVLNGSTILHWETYSYYNCQSINSTMNRLLITLDTDELKL